MKNLFFFTVVMRFGSTSLWMTFQTNLTLKLKRIFSLLTWHLLILSSSLMKIVFCRILFTLERNYCRMHWRVVWPTMWQPLPSQKDKWVFTTVQCALSRGLHSILLCDVYPSIHSQATTWSILSHLPVDGLVLSQCVSSIYKLLWLLTRCLCLHAVHSTVLLALKSLVTCLLSFLNSWDIFFSPTFTDEL